MIVKIFKAAASFKAIGYNFRKLLVGKGELMRVAGFDALKALNEIRAEDYLNYLEAQSALNSNVRLPQFHAMISAPDSSYDKHELTKLAEKWLEAMGYGKQPYLLVFHKDTDQAHIHIVSTRVKRNGEKIDSAFEHKRAVRELNRLMQLDEAHQAQLDAGKALRYQCATKAQLMLLLEGMGYRCAEKEGNLILYKFGQPIFAITEKRIADQLGNWSPDKRRALQLKAIIRKYQAIYDSSLQRETKNLSGGRMQFANSYRSDLSDFLQKELGLQFVFHAAEGKPPYGYTIIDHTQKRVFKGSEVMKLGEYLSPGAGQPVREGAGKTDISGEQMREDGSYQPPLRPNFTNDVDDQQLHGPRRRRRKKARTNTR